MSTMSKKLESLANHRGLNWVCGHKVQVIQQAAAELDKLKKQRDFLVKAMRSVAYDLNNGLVTPEAAAARCDESLRKSREIGRTKAWHSSS